MCACVCVCVPVCLSVCLLPMHSHTTGGIWTKFGMEILHTPGKVIGYVMAVGGRGSIDPGNRWRDVDQIWHGGSKHPPGRL